MKEGYKRYWHKEHQIPISFKSGSWIGYDDPDSIKNKCRYVKRERLGGAMIWTLDMDDFNGEFCRKNRKDRTHKFPLVNAMKEEFELEQIQSSTMTNIKTTTTMIQLNDSFLFDFNGISSNFSSSTNRLTSNYFLLIRFLTCSYLIRSTIDIIS